MFFVTARNVFLRNLTPMVRCIASCRSATFLQLDVDLFPHVAQVQTDAGPPRRDREEQQQVRRKSEHGAVPARSDPERQRIETPVDALDAERRAPASPSVGDRVDDGLRFVSRFVGQSAPETLANRFRHREVDDAGELVQHEKHDEVRRPSVPVHVSPKQQYHPAQSHDGHERQRSPWSTRVRYPRAQSRDLEHEHGDARRHVDLGQEGGVGLGTVVAGRRAGSFGDEVRTLEREKGGRGGVQRVEGEYGQE